MGAFVSVPECQAHYNITLNCTFTRSNETGRRYQSIGEFERGQFPADPDVAGVGILGVFIAVTSFAIFISFIDVIWQVAKVWNWKKTLTEEEKEQKGIKRSLSEILETVVVACSDQQVFTGAAYALTLRYWKGCTISAYHYNLIANMMLLTCATHLMSVTIVRNYWKYPWLALLRVICTAGVLIITGLLFTNQNAREYPAFPTTLPPANETDSLIFLPAACFQTENNTATDTFEATTANSTAFWNTLKWSKPGNMIQGWNWYVVILLFYGAAIIAEFIRFCRRGKSRPGWRANLARSLGRCFGRGTFPRRIVQNIFLIYLMGGVGISMAATIISARYIFSLRRWADRSGWIETENNQNPENDFSSFGQLVPIWTSVMIIFSFFGIVSEKITRRGNRKHAGEERPPQTGTIPYLDPSHYDLFNSPPPEKPGANGSTSYFSPNLEPSNNNPAAAATTPGSTIDLESGRFGKPPRIGDIGSIDFLGSSPLLGSSGAGLAITTPDGSSSPPQPLGAATRPTGNSSSNGNGGASDASSSGSRPTAQGGLSPAPSPRPQAPGTPALSQQASEQRPKPPSKKNSSTQLP